MSYIVNSGEDRYSMLKNCSLKVQAISESQTLAISSLAKKLISNGIDIVSLNAGEPDFPTPENVRNAAITAIQNNFTKYTQNEGIPELREAVAEKFRRENNLDVRMENILISSGGKQSLYNALLAICNPGDEVIVIAPYYVSYPEMVRLADAKPVIFETSEDDDFHIDFDKLGRLFSERTKAIIINSPSNPTGSVYKEEELRKLAEIALKYDVYVISDEIYEKIIFDREKHFSIGSIKEIAGQVITINGVSKAYAMTGWRIGFMAASEEIIRLSSKVQSQVTSNASSISQAAALEAIKNSSEYVEVMRQEYQLRRDFVYEQLLKIEGITISKPYGAFYAFPSVKHFFGRSYGTSRLNNSIDISEFLLNEARVAVVPGLAFGSDNHIRLSFASSIDDLNEGLTRITKALESLT
ncbi:MAG: pyridoxal phosphate-dependent aminotransferase [Candidatus Kryptoniota bacterium]